MKSNDYLYNSFLPYFEALQLCRWMNCLCDMSRRLHRSGHIPENLAEAASCNLRVLAPQIRPATSSPEEFASTLAREEKLAKMTDEEKEEFYAQEWKKVEAKIESGEIDIWDDTPTYADTEETKRFIRDSIEYFNSKLSQAVNPNASFLEALALRVFQTLDKVQGSIQPELLKQVRGLEALLLTWDTARMAHEGRPPYSIKFSEQVAEALGIDPVVEESKMATDYALPERFARIALVAATLARNTLPEYQREIDAMAEKIRQTKKQ